MMLSASPNSVARSSLEEMLDSLRRRDECEKPRDLPPALPARPTSRSARLPSARKSLPVDFKVGSESEVKGKEEGKRKEKELGTANRNSFGGKKAKKAAECPYLVEERNRKEKVATVREEVKIGEGEWNNNIDYFINKKLRVWCRLLRGQWESGTIQTTSGEEATVSLSNGNVVKVPTGDLFPANPHILEGVDDLIQLSYLNEPSVLHNLQYRYSRDLIYSKAGPILIAVNPFKDVKIYGNDFVIAYRQKVTDSPHVYAIADTAYNEMMRDGVNQSVIISGESGAGKTETAKFAMQYLTALGGGSGRIEYEVLQTNCILESFGNAKTSRNDNSSRFGKLIEIHFSTLGKICGAKIQTFLLEKSRVVQLADGERSYHIFYQLCAGAPSNLKERLHLKLAQQYNYLNQSECLAIDGVDDAQKFHKLLEALNIVQICKEDQEHAFAMLAAVLWLGNISFKVIDNENHVLVLADEALSNAARLMNCSAPELMLALSTHKIQAGKDCITKKLTLRQATDRRDALAKFIYASLFDWLVEQINESLAVGKLCTGRSISIIDIYGFESFKKNSFEQFCINYANERLQQHFNRHLLKLEQEEYELDGIDWTKVDFEDNQECLNLFETKPLGLLSLLDEESNFPRATDLTFANKLKQHLNANPCFKGERGRAFSIRHYAGEVLYDTNGFLEKNRDPLHSDFIELLSSCSCPLPNLFASKMLNQSQRPGSSPCQFGTVDTPKQSVGTKFKGQLFKLMNQLENTTPHFIRCIKPNSKQLPGMYEEALVLQQLRCCGVLEVVRISRSGYPTRMTHQEFAGRYGFLLLDNSVPQDPLSISVAIQITLSNLKKYFHIAVVRSEIARRKYGIMANEQMAAIICLQSGKTYVVHVYMALFVVLNFLNIFFPAVIRGFLVRRQFKDMHNLKDLIPEIATFKRKTDKKISDKQDIPQQQFQGPHLVVAELQRRVFKAEATLGKKEEENAALREELKQFEVRWLEYEGKMKSMEEMWQKQMASLQMSLSAARKSLANDNNAGQPGRLDTSASPRYYDSEETMSMGSRTPGGSTPFKFSNAGVGRETNGSLNAVSNLIKEFEQRRQSFDDDSKDLVEVKIGQSAPSMNPDEELRKLKLRFQTWKKEYKVRLRETKARIHKLPEYEKSRRKWWGKLSSKAS
ncbi:LOW QUALITY PROTEIN: Myosin_head domain-containing protein [Cephalotus follicularis]|uniref:Myosin_head domain-containing protein n=1 Tax=Cephalotus follicularis TaxID=3775 RepID=A0A1Q3CYM8_CEPFO|nr:LOW QUALITY PROTEIN: Myosin_head domain-containing protein [Cephalotus follicularis]